MIFSRIIDSRSSRFIYLLLIKTAGSFYSRKVNFTNKCSVAVLLDISYVFSKVPHRIFLIDAIGKCLAGHSEVMEFNSSNLPPNLPAFFRVATAYISALGRCTIESSFWYLPILQLRYRSAAFRASHFMLRVLVHRFIGASNADSETLHRGWGPDQQPRFYVASPGASL